MGIITELFYVALSFFRMTLPRGNFTADYIPDLSGQVHLVTGGNAGIGKETIKVLLRRNAKVYLAARSQERAEEAIKQLKAETGKEPVFLQLDLSDLASVRRAAEEFLGKERELHVLYNNAAVMSTPMDVLAPGGYDMQFATNIIGPFLFTELLMPALFAAAETSPDHHARIVALSSAAAMWSTLYFDTLKDGPARRQRHTPDSLYSQTKFANVVITRQIAKRYGDKGIVALSVDPGNIETDISKYAKAHGTFSSYFWKIFTKIALRPLWWGVLTPLWAGTSPEALNHNGEYAIPVGQVVRCRPEAYDDQLGQKLWKWLEQQVEGQ